MSFNIDKQSVQKHTDTTVAGKYISVIIVRTFTAAASRVPFSVSRRMLMFSLRASSASNSRECPLRRFRRPDSCQWPSLDDFDYDYTNYLLLTNSIVLLTLMCKVCTFLWLESTSLRFSRSAKSIGSNPASSDMSTPLPKSR